jgi:hypothetical protein
MAALSTDALLVILFASTLAMLATWVLCRGRGSMARRLLVMACAFFAGVSIGTTFALAMRTPWLWSSLRLPRLSAARTEAVASNHAIPVPVTAVPSAAQVPSGAEPPSDPSNEPGTSHASAQPSNAGFQSSNTPA